MVILFLLGIRLSQDNDHCPGRAYYLTKTALPLSWKSLLPNKNRITIVLEEPTT
jgi:hypothetical protein